MFTSRRYRLRILVTACLALAALVVVAPGSGAATSKADAALQRALDAFVKRADGSPRVSVVVQRGSSPTLFTAGVADTTTKQPIAIDDAMRLASVAKAFSGAAAVSRSPTAN
jgi:D-alanyl-D-alanine carboxypeptidase